MYPLYHAVDIIIDAVRNDFWQPKVGCIAEYCKQYQHKYQTRIRFQQAKNAGLLGFIVGHKRLIYSYTIRAGKNSNELLFNMQTINERNNFIAKRKFCQAVISPSASSGK